MCAYSMRKKGGQQKLRHNVTILGWYNEKENSPIMCLVIWGG